MRRILELLMDCAFGVVFVSFVGLGRWWLRLRLLTGLARFIWLRVRLRRARRVHGKEHPAALRLAQKLSRLHRRMARDAQHLCDLGGVRTAEAVLAWMRLD